MKLIDFNASKIILFLSLENQKIIDKKTYSLRKMFNDTNELRKYLIRK